MSAREPRARAWHAAVGVRDKLFVWGGLGEEPIQSTTLNSFNVSTLTWEPPRQLNGPLPDVLGCSAVAGDGETFYSCAGSTGTSGCINALYKINPSMVLCREMLPNSPSHAPPKNQGSRSVYFKSKIVVYGGYTDQGHTILL